MKFKKHVGIDYSGAQTPESRLKALQVYAAVDNEELQKVYFCSMCRRVSL
jgi:hypothetical protein